MKKFLTVLCVCAALATASFDADAARRFGGGASFGRSAPTFTQKAPTPGTAPLTAKKPAAQQNVATNARTNPAAAQQRPSMMRSVLTGLAAALGISALLSMLGINGAGMVSFVMGLILVLAAVAAFRFFMGSRRRQAQASAAGASQSAMHVPPAQEAVRPEETEPAAARVEPVSQTNAAAQTGSVLDQFMRGEKAATAAEADGAVDITPADFDREGFLQTARNNYIKLQAAWDSGNVITLSDFTTNDVFIAITHQLRERGNEVYTTKILSLSNELLGIAQEGDEYVASVRFIGKLSINNEDELVDETWTLVKPVEGKGGWLLAGIKQNEPVIQA